MTGYIRETGDKRSVRQQLLLFALSLLAAVAILLSSAGRYAFNRTIDGLFQLRGPVTAPEDVVIVAIDEPSFAEIGLRWPWPRGLHGDLVDILAAAGASTVAFDVVFSEASDAANDARLAQAIESHGNIILASDIQTIVEATYEHRVTVRPAPRFVAAGALDGFANLPLDMDGTLRRVRAEMEGLEPLSFAAARRHRAAKDGASVPLAREATSLIDFVGPPRSIKTVSFYQALDPVAHLPKGVFEGKLLIIGLSVNTTVDAENYRSDYFPTPYSSFGGAYMSGAEIQATIASNLLSGRHLSEARRELGLAFGLLLASVSMIVLARFGLLPAFIFTTVTWLGTAAACYWLFTDHGLVVNGIDLVLPISVVFLADWGHGYFRTLLQKRYIRSLFSTYVGPQIVDELERNPWRLDERGSEHQATVMFLDIAGFTSLSERMPPHDLLRLLNHILSEVSDRVIEHGGLIDKYIGDAVMAVWGAPVANERHAELACRAALEVSAAVDKVNRDRKIEPPVDFRIGINSGFPVAGNVGGAKHRNFSFFSDDVNLASRLEGLNDYYGTRITVSEATVDELPPGFHLREVDLVRVKGKKKPIRTFELQEDGANRGANAEAVNPLFAEGLAAYRAGDWDQAQARFEAGLAVAPEDGPCKEFVERCKAYRANPPEGEWDGITNMTSK